MGLAISSIVAIRVYGFLYDKFNNYTIALIAIIVMLLVNIVIVFAAYKNNWLKKDIGIKKPSFLI